MLLWRTSSWLYRHGAFKAAKILKGVSFFVFRAILPPEAELGEDVRLEHYGLNVMIHPNTVIGDRCRIYQGVTVASTANIGSDDRVLIGNDVLIGAGATILNRPGRTLRIGDGCRIGVKALVVHDLPAGTIVRAPVGELVTPGVRH
jgi:serine O-acetyltransferase